MALISLITTISSSSDVAPRCLESIAQQSLEDFECFVVLLDKEETPAYIKTLVQQDPRFKIIQPENSLQNIWEGYNIALKHVRSEFLMFVDSNDLLHPDMISILFDSIRYTHADIAISPNAYFSGKKHLKSLTKKIPFHKGILKKKSKDLFKEYLQDSLFGMTLSVEGKLFKKNSLNTLRFRHNLGEYTPLFFMEQFLVNAEQLVYMKYPVYFLRQETHIPALASFETLSYLAKRCLIEKEYLIDNSRINGYNVLLLKRRCSQEFFTALKQFILHAPDGILICTHQQVLALIAQLRDKDFMQGIALSFIQKIIVGCLNKNKIGTAKRLLRFFS